MTSDNQQKTGDSDTSSSEKQNQLKFEFNNMEPITPKKPIEEKPSFLDKAKGLLPKREHKEESVNPTNPQQPTATEADIETIRETETVVTNEITAEREPLSQRLKKPETWGLLNRLPAKHRRLFIALLGLFLLLLIFFWMKPSSTTTVDALQAQNANSLPIEFQSLNPSEEEQTNQPAESLSSNDPLLQNAINEANTQSPASATAQAESLANVATSVTQAPAQVNEPVAQNQQAQAVAAPRQETAREQTRATPPARQQQAATSTARTNQQPARQAAANNTNRQTSSQAAESSASASTRTLTIPQGVSLMQVFRNNNLSIADVNAMTKANGGEKALSSFKPGDKVTIQLNAQGRVSRLTLQNGSSFSRNSDGSYNYKP